MIILKLMGSRNLTKITLLSLLQLLFSGEDAFTSASEGQPLAHIIIAIANHNNSQ